MTKTIEFTREDAELIMDLLDDRLELEKSIHFDQERVSYLISLSNKFFDAFERDECYED